MEIYKLGFTMFIVFLMSIQHINSTKDVKQTTTGPEQKSNPLANVILNQNVIGDVNRSEEHTKNTLSRMKRQFYYNPDWRNRRPYYPLPLPIIIGGGFGFGQGFGGRGFGGRGFGGRGFGGRGFGGRGFGGGGFGGGRGGRG